VLKAASIRTGANGLPLAATGKSAIVFHASVASRNVALRCFTRNAAGQRERYQELHEYLSNALPGYFVDFSYRDREILVSGERYPVVLMDWAEGKPLDKWISANVRRSGDLKTLAEGWLGITRDMQRRSIAHGDLANDNLLVNGSGIKLIDYDGCFIPELAEADPGEAGNPHFQHPKRKTGYYALNVDAFPALVIYLSLLALSHNSSLWSRFHDHEGLIFADADYRAPRSTPIWRELGKIRDPMVTSLTEALADMCDAPIDGLHPLSDLVPNGHDDRPRFSELLADLGLATLPHSVPAPSTGEGDSWWADWKDTVRTGPGAPAPVASAPAASAPAASPPAAQPTLPPAAQPTLPPAAATQPTLPLPAFQAPAPPAPLAPPGPRRWPSVVALIIVLGAIALLVLLIAH
jgi:hypothetical protein